MSGDSVKRIAMLMGLAIVGAGCAASESRGRQDDRPAGRHAAADQPVEDFQLQDLTRDDTRLVSLSQFRGKTVVLFFLSPKCNTSRGYEGRLGRILEDYRGKNVEFVGVRSSSADTNEETRQYVREKKLDIPVLVDDRSRLAEYFKVSNTPTFVVIDPQGRMRYWGALDDHFDEKRAKRRYLRDAIDAAAAGKEVATKRGLGLG